MRLISSSPHCLDPAYRPAEGTPLDFDGPGPAPAMPTDPNYNPSDNPGSFVVDSSLRTISNLIVDQTLGNPAAILTALQRAGSTDETADLAAVTAIYQTFKPAFEAEYQARVVAQNSQAAAEALGDGDPLTIPGPEEQAAIDAAALDAAAHGLTVEELTAARQVRDAALAPFGISMEGDNISLPNISPDEGLSAPFNSWFTLFGQFFDHGLDLVNKGGSGTVFIPLQPDDPLYVEGSQTNFMVLTRATVSAGAGRRPRHRRRYSPGQHHDVVRRPEPDLHLASVAPGVPARVRAQRRRRSGRDRQADRGRQRRHGHLGRGQGAGAARCSAST